MAVNIITSGFLLLVLVAGVQSAIKELDATCATADTCVSPLAELVCDKPPSGTGGKCRVKAGQACKAAGGLCVVGAICDSGTGNCTCAAGYSPALASGQCTVPTNGYYFTCTNNADTACTKSGLLKAATSDCSSDGGCQCVTPGTPAPDYATGNCIALVNEKVGQTCSTGDAATTCGTNSATHLSCVNTKCTCDAGYFPTQTPGGTCVANSASTVRKACTTATAVECTGQNEVCTTSPCACKTGFTAAPGGVCYPDAGTLKGGCSGTSCTGSLKCTSYQSAPYTCKTEVTAGGNCTDTTSTVCATGLTCNDNKCKTELPLSGNCTDTAKTFCGAGLGCNANICSNASTVIVTAVFVMAVALVSKLMM